MSRIREELDRIRDLPDQELVEALSRARDELFRLRLGNYTNQVENTNLLREKRRELARIMTVQRARDLALESQSTAAGRAVEGGARRRLEAAPAKKPRASKKAAEGARPRLPRRPRRRAERSRPWLPRPTRLLIAARPSRNGVRAGPSPVP